MKKNVFLLLMLTLLLSAAGAESFSIGSWKVELPDPAGTVLLSNPDGKSIRLRIALALPPWKFASSAHLRGAKTQKNDSGAIIVTGDVVTAEGVMPLECIVTPADDSLKIEWNLKIGKELKFTVKPFLQCVCNGFTSDELLTVVNKKMNAEKKNIWLWGTSWKSDAGKFDFVSESACPINYLLNGDVQEVRMVAPLSGNQSKMVCRLLLSEGKPQYTALRIDGKCSRSRALFAPGETMEFSFQALDGEKPLETKGLFWSWTRSGDDGKTESGKSEFTGEALKLSTSLDRPGFVWYQVALVDHNGMTPGGKKNVYNAGAGVNIEAIEGGTPPADLAEFRHKQRQRLKATPLSAEIVPVKSVAAGVNTFKVKVAAPGDRPVTGYLTIPDKPGTFPAQVNFYGYSKDSVQKPLRTSPLHRIDLWVNAHGYELEQPPEYYQEFYKKINTAPAGYAWNEAENQSPDTAYFNGMSLRAARAAQFLTTLPEWNQKEICAAGGSQGGLQALWCAWLAPETVTRVAVEKPWCCFLEGPRKGYFSAGLTMKPFPGVLYFDPVNFSSQLNIPVNIYYAGLGDYMCPPSGLAALFNRLPDGSKMTFYQGGTHGGAPTGSQNFTLTK